jgi:hypothetical protein
MSIPIFSVVDRQPFDVDPDPPLYFDGDTDPGVTLKLGQHDNYRLQILSVPRTKQQAF